MNDHLVPYFAKLCELADEHHLYVTYNTREQIEQALIEEGVMTPEELRALEELFRAQVPEPEPAAAPAIETSGVASATAPPAPSHVSTRKVEPIREGDYLYGGFARFPNLARQFKRYMSLPVLRAYDECCALANRQGHFRVSQAKLAEAMGTSDRKAATRALAQLVEAGLMERTKRGGSNAGSNHYRLLCLDGLDPEKVREVLSRPLQVRK